MLHPIYPQKLTLTLPTNDGRSVGIVRSRTHATEFSLCNIVMEKADYPIILLVRLARDDNCDILPVYLLRSMSNYLTNCCDN
jgi:hypothetical protein